METASDPIFPQQFTLGVVPEPGKSNTSGSCNVNEGKRRFEYEFASLVTFLTLESILDRNLQDNHLLQASAFCLEISCVVKLCVLEGYMAVT